MEKIITLKASQVKPNPYKKDVDGGEINRMQVDILKANMNELGMMNPLPICKKGNDYYLVSGHHRLKAYQEVFGKDAELMFIVKEYDDETMYRGLIIENMTQKSMELKKRVKYVASIREYLQRKAPCQDSGHGQKRNKDGEFEGIAGSVRDIGSWLNKSGIVLSREEIHELLSINDNVPKEIIEETEATHKGKEEGRREGGVVSESQLRILSKLKDKSEIKDIAEALKNSTEQRVREQGKLMTVYKVAPEEIKEQVRSGSLDLADVEDATMALKQKARPKTEFIPNMQARVDNLIHSLRSVNNELMVFKKAFSDSTFINKYHKSDKVTQQKVKAVVHKAFNEVRDAYKEVEGIYNRLSMGGIEHVKNKR